MANKKQVLTLKEREDLVYALAVVKKLHDICLNSGEKPDLTFLDKKCVPITVHVALHCLKYLTDVFPVKTKDKE